MTLALKDMKVLDEMLKSSRNRHKE